MYALRPVPERTGGEAGGNLSSRRLNSLPAAFAESRRNCGRNTRWVLPSNSAKDGSYRKIRSNNPKKRIDPSRPLSLPPVHKVCCPRSNRSYSASPASSAFDFQHSFGETAEGTEDADERRNFETRI